MQIIQEIIRPVNSSLDISASVPAACQLLEVYCILQPTLRECALRKCPGSIVDAAIPNNSAAATGDEGGQQQEHQGAGAGVGSGAGDGGAEQGEGGGADGGREEQKDASHLPAASGGGAGQRQEDNRQALQRSSTEVRMLVGRPMRCKMCRLQQVAGLQGNKSCTGDYFAYAASTSLDTTRGLQRLSSSGMVCKKTVCMLRRSMHTKIKHPHPHAPEHSRTHTHTHAHTHTHTHTPHTHTGVGWAQPSSPSRHQRSFSVDTPGMHMLLAQILAACIQTEI
eukprot:scaffold66525_cov20-Tisochrysis_lutea.AAC.1